MKPLLNFLYHYLFGVIISVLIIGTIILCDYIVKGYWLYPELNNFIKTVFYASFGGAMLHYAYFNINKSNKNN
jgi:tellurite resistance protein TehA-like permease